MKAEELREIMAMEHCRSWMEKHYWGGVTVKHAGGKSKKIIVIVYRHLRSRWNMGGAVEKIMRDINFCMVLSGRKERFSEVPGTAVFGTDGERSYLRITMIDQGENDQ